MNFLELINKCLVELNYKSVTDFSDLTTGDHVRLKGIINRLNNELVLGFDWSFRQAKADVVFSSGSFEHDYPVEGKIEAIYIDEVKCHYEPEYQRFYEGVTSENAYSIYGDKVLIGPFEEDEAADVFYYANKPAMSASGVLKSEMVLESDESVIPVEYAENVLVYGACMRFKAMPSHPKYKHWSAEYVRALRLLQGANVMTGAQEPCIRVQGDL